MKTVITKQERLQIIGLMTLAKQYSQKIVDLERGVHEIIEEPKNYSLLSDEIYQGGDLNVDKCLENMDIEVK